MTYRVGPSEDCAYVTASSSNTVIDRGRWLVSVPPNSQVADVRKAACHLVEIAALVHRNGNTNEFMESLCKAMNGVCQAMGERDAVGYNRDKGSFVVVTL